MCYWSHKITCSKICLTNLCGSVWLVLEPSLWSSNAIEKGYHSELIKVQHLNVF